MLISIVLVAALYLVMNISILGVVPWQELGQVGAMKRALTLLHASATDLWDMVREYSAPS